MSEGEKEQACRDQDYATMEMMTYDEGNDDCDYFGDGVDEVDIPPANKSAEKRRPIMHLAGKGQPLITRPSSLLYGGTSVSTASSLARSLSRLYHRSSSMALLANKDTS